MNLPDPNQTFIRGTVGTAVGGIPLVSSRLSPADRWGSIKARWGVGRMHFTVDPGLYALGSPGPESPVLVTANYKMSFDRLREALTGRDAWILVLDTKGINVWCAAGKGTFGTEELVRRIQSSGLDRIVSHRRVILPQLAGSGVAAYKVRKLSGFGARYGPVRAKDLPSFLDAGFKATPEMREKTFTGVERAVLIPVELVAALKWVLIICALLFIIGGLSGGRGFRDGALHSGLFAVMGILAAVGAGAVMTPLLLPWLPGRAFTLKGLTLGLMTAMLLALFRLQEMGSMKINLEILAWFLMAPAVAGFLAMNFTGASTYTSLSGVRREMKWAVPVEIGAGCLGLMLWLGSLFMA